MTLGIDPERKLQALLSVYAGAGFVIDEDGRYLEVLEGSGDSLLYDDADELRGRRFHDLLPVETAERFLEVLRTALDEDEVQFLEYDLDVNVGRRWFEAAVAPVASPDLDVETVVWVARDVTDRVQRKRQLKERGERLRVQFDHAPDGIVVHDEDGEILDVNRTLVDRMGYDRETLLEMTVDEFDVRYDHDELESMWSELDPDSRLTAESEHRRADGSTLPVEVWVHRIDVDDETRFVAHVRDVTERKERERAVVAQKRKIEALHDVASSIGACDDPGTVYDAVVDAAEEILAFDIAIADEAIGDVLVPRAVSSDLSSEQYYEETPIDAEDNFGAEVYRSGETRVVDDLHDHGVDPASAEFRSVLTVPIGDHGIFQSVDREPGVFDEADVELAELLVSHARARLDALETTARLKERTTELEQQNDRLEEFTSVVSHDLRNPLTVAYGEVQMARADDDLSRLDEALSALDRMDALIENLLTLAREGDAVGELEVLDLQSQIESCWGAVDTDGGELLVETDRVVQADRTRLRQLLENLLRNSVEHGSTGPPSHAREDSVEHGADGSGNGAVTVTVGDLDDDAGFYVADDGPGIPESEREAIFESGYSKGDEGTGFGLSIVRTIVDAHGWDIRVTESEAGGARFEIVTGGS